MYRVPLNVNQDIEHANLQYEMSQSDLDNPAIPETSQVEFPESYKDFNLSHLSPLSAQIKLIKEKLKEPQLSNYCEQIIQDYTENLKAGVARSTTLFNLLTVKNLLILAKKYGNQKDLAASFKISHSSVTQIAYILHLHIVDIFRMSDTLVKNLEQIHPDPLEIKIVDLMENVDFDLTRDFKKVFYLITRFNKLSRVVQILGVQDHKIAADSYKYFLSKVRHFLKEHNIPLNHPNYKIRKQESSYKNIREMCLKILINLPQPMQEDLENIIDSFSNTIKNEIVRGSGNFKIEINQLKNSQNIPVLPVPQETFSIQNIAMLNHFIFNSNHPQQENTPDILDEQDLQELQFLLNADELENNTAEVNTNILNSAKPAIENSTGDDTSTNLFTEEEIQHLEFLLEELGVFQTLEAQEEIIKYDSQNAQDLNAPVDNDYQDFPSEHTIALSEHEENEVSPHSQDNLNISEEIPSIANLSNNFFSHEKRALQADQLKESQIASETLPVNKKSRQDAQESDFYALELLAQAASLR